MTSLFRRLRWWLRHSDKEAELREELQFHLEAETEERQHDGLSRQAARFAARRELGNVTLLQENTRAVWIPVWLEQSFQELRYESAHCGVTAGSRWPRLRCLRSRSD